MPSHSSTSLRRTGCRHCATCQALTTCSNQADMWPAGLQSPTVYYMLRELDLRIQSPGSGVQLGDAVVYVRAVQPGSQKPLRPTAFRFSTPASAPGAAAVPTQQCMRTPPPQLQQQRVKRIRVSQATAPASGNTTVATPPFGGFCFSTAAPLSVPARPHSPVVPWFWKSQGLPCPHQQFAAAVATCAAACRAC
ncbi:hypothetical protein D9Q98_009527 [Chlorella vulgaris]|uniref:Uncharacterized protein n=1 Tax=Chlorella vulgaris TaxID=3077 RepID=A0A9D4TFD0_CHLVU|nr:hypothetical protein D9Q98_009527 [Chlorella vulgaris]